MTQVRTNRELNDDVHAHDRAYTKAMEEGSRVRNYQEALDALVSFRKYVRSLPSDFVFERNKDLSHFAVPGASVRSNVQKLIFSRQDLLLYVESELRSMRNWRRAEPHAFGRSRK